MKKLIACLLFISCLACQKSFSPNDLLQHIPTTYLTTQSQGLFTQQMQKNQFSRFYLKDHTETYTEYFNLSINLNPDGSITYRSTPSSFDELLADITDFIDFAAEGKTTMLHINFNQKVSLQHYQQLIKILLQIQSETIQINPNVFIYDAELLPDCDCTL